MKVILGPLIAQGSGKLGGLVMSRNRGGTYARRRAHPTIVTSDAANQAKNTFAHVSAAWAKLGVSAREAWTLWGANNPIKDRIGSTITLDGHASYVRCNALQELAGVDEVELPPTVGPPRGLLHVDTTGIVSSSILNVTFDPPQTGLSTLLMLTAAIKTSAARNYVKGSTRLCGFSGAMPVSQWNILTLVQERLGTLQNDDILHIAVATFDPATGLRSLPLSASAPLSGIPET